MTEQQAETEEAEEAVVYRVYGNAGECLYIGVSKNFTTRWVTHARLQPWWPEKRSQTVTWYASRAEALAAEKAAIAAESPKYNVVYNDAALLRQQEDQDAETAPALDDEDELAEEVDDEDPSGGESPDGASKDQHRRRVSEDQHRILEEMRAEGIWDEGSRSFQREYACRLTATWPPLTERQLDRLRPIFASARLPDDSSDEDAGVT